MLRRRQINADSGADALRSKLDAATEPVRAAAWAARERVLWEGADRLRPLIEIARLPFERLAWVVQRRLIWPVQDRTEGIGHLLAATALSAVGLAAMAMGVVSLTSGSDPGSLQLAAPAPGKLAATDAKPSPPKEDGPVLRGAAPSFRPGTDAEDSAKSESSDVAAISSTGSVSEEGAGTAATSRRAVPAGPAAMKVARRFSEAFVFYEVGDRSARTEAVFAETTTPRLAAALEERPPRQPEGIDVPRARVLNLVPGPRRGRTYTVSASLLRVGLTSELRLEMEKKNGIWLITDVRG
jgi:hypothetical protein